MTTAIKTASERATAIENAAEQFVAHAADERKKGDTKGLDAGMLDYFAEIFGEALASLPSLPEGEPELPAPEGYRYWSHGHSPRWTFTKVSTPDSEPLYTADQMRMYGRQCAALAAGRAEPEKLPEGWVPLTITFEGDHPEEVAYGPQHMMDRLKKWLDKFYAMRLAAPSQPVGSALKVTDAMVLAYLDAQRAAVEEADKFGRPNVGGLHTNTVREACRAGITAALAALTPEPAALPAEVEGWHAPGIGEVHNHDHTQMIYCMKAADPDQHGADEIMDDDLAKRVCAALATPMAAQPAAAEAVPEELLDMATKAVAAYEDRFESITGRFNGPIDTEMRELAAILESLAAPAQPAPEPAAEPADEYDRMKAQKDQMLQRERERHCKCDECGKAKSAGWALYCVECSGKFYAPSEPAADAGEVEKPIARIHDDGYWTHLNGWKEPLNFASMEVYAAPTRAQEPQAAEKNDRRYRWLRDWYEDIYTLDDDGERIFAIKAFGASGESATKLDEAIDAAIESIDRRAGS